MEFEDYIYTTQIKKEESIVAESRNFANSIGSLQLQLQNMQDTINSLYSRVRDLENKSDAALG